MFLTDGWCISHELGPLCSIWPSRTQQELVTFPLRLPCLAFAICGRRWQNDVHEIKYSVWDDVIIIHICNSNGHGTILPVSSSLGPGSTVRIKVKRAKQKLGEGKLGSRAWRPAFDAAICLSAIITLTNKTILGKKNTWIMFEPHPCYNLGTGLICGYFMKDSLHIIQCRSPEVGISASLHIIA